LAGKPEMGSRRRTGKTDRVRPASAVRVLQFCHAENRSVRPLNLNRGWRDQRQRPRFRSAKGRQMIISLTAIYVAGTVALIMAGFVAAAVQD
jgi:hypothetical protein